MAVGAIAVLVLSCGDGAVEPTPPLAPMATTVTVNPASAALSALGETARLTAEVRDQNAQAMAGAAVAWESSEVSVASVDASGLVTAVAAGTATVTATAGAVSGTATVTVVAARSAPPTWVFVGDIPESTQTLLRTEMEHARGYFANQYGVEATGFTVLFGDYESLGPVYERMTGQDFPLHPSSSTNSTAWVTQSPQGGAVVTLMNGLEQWALSSAVGFIVHEYFHVLQGQLAAEIEPVGNGETRWSHDAPKWMVEGYAVYAEYEYSPTRFLESHTPYSDLRQGVIYGELDLNNVTALLALDRYASCDWTSWTTYSLSFLATLFLSSHAPDGAYVEFWKLLPERATWKDAFREAFGLDYDSFEEAFEQWILPQIPTYDRVRMRVLWPERNTDPENPLDAISISAEEISWERDEYGHRMVTSVERPHGALRPPIDFTITVPAGSVGTAVLSLWWRNEPPNEYLLGWYKHGELTDNREDATPFMLTGVSQDVEWRLPAHPSTLPRLACRQSGYRRPCS